MKISSLCPKCSADKVVYPVETEGYPGTPIKVSIRHLRTPINLNIPDTFPIQAAVCGHCGYTELYVADPDTFYQKWNETE